MNLVLASEVLFGADFELKFFFSVIILVNVKGQSYSFIYFKYMYYYRRNIFGEWAGIAQSV